jgi:hypothetical protein
VHEIRSRDDAFEVPIGDDRKLVDVFASHQLNRGECVLAGGVAMPGSFPFDPPPPPRLGPQWAMWAVLTAMVLLVVLIALLLLAS